MKKITLSIVMLPFIISCNNNSTADTNSQRTGDTITAITDTSKPIKIEKKMELGLTLEELQDDTVFIDGSIPTSWEVAGITDVKAFKLFLKNLQTMVLNDEKESIAGFIHYPLGKSIKTEADFIKNYPNLFTKDVKLSIANINLQQVFRNSKGVMTEGGRVWFAQDGEAFRIIAINN